MSRGHPASRSADAIGRTAIGPRAMPDLIRVKAARPPASQESLLGNGLTVIAVRRTGAPLVEVRLWIPFGGAAEQHAARAELLAASAMLGTAERSREDVNIALAEVGGTLHATVDPERLMFTGSVLANGLPALLNVLAEVLTTAAYRKSDVLGERDRLVEHLTLAAAEPSTAARRALQRQRFGTHPASREMPDVEQVAEVTPAAVRGLHRRAVVPGGATFVLVGDLSPKRTIGQVEAVLAPWTAPRAATVLGTPPPVVGSDVRALHRDGSVQSQVRLTGPALTRSSPVYTALQVANLVYGGYFSSRLMENIREDKGYTYSAGSTIEFWPGRAALTVAFDTTTESTAAALLEARYELGKLALTAPTSAEVESARNYALGTLAISLGTHAGFASTLARIHGAGLDLSWLRAHPARLAAVTLEQVAAAAADHLAPSQFTGIVLGDLDVIAGGLSRVGGVSLP